MAKPICKDCGSNLMGHLIVGVERRRCTSCHAKWKASFNKHICLNCGADVISPGKCDTCRRNYPHLRVLDASNINEMLWYEGKKAWE